MIWSFQSDAFGPDPFNFLIGTPDEPNASTDLVTVEEDVCFGPGQIPSGIGAPVRFRIMDDLGQTAFVPGMTTFTVPGGTLTGRFSESFQRTF